jgi:putative aldouronate transport system permease protein
VFVKKELFMAFKVTLLRTIIGTVTSVFFTAIVAYPLSKRKLAFRKIYLRVGIITMYFWGGLIPFYLVLRSLDLLDKFIVYIIPGLFSFFNAILFIKFFSELPDALEESAKIDGANDLFIFFKIIIPLSGPIIGTISLFNGVAHWNAFFDAAYYTNNPKLQTLQCILYKIISQSEGAEMMRRMMGGKDANTSSIDAIKYATMIVSIVPITIMCPFLQKFFIKGMMLGAIKG